MVANFCVDFNLYQFSNHMSGDGYFQRSEDFKTPSKSQNLERTTRGGHQLFRSLSASSACHLRRGWKNIRLIQQDVQPQPVTTGQLNLNSANRRAVSVSHQGIPLHLTRNHPRPHPQMTIGSFQANTRPLQQQRSMDSYFLDDLCYNSTVGDHSLQSFELGSIDTSIYASSPNSLYMYDQEKADMQSSYTNGCNSSSLFFSDDFDLKSQYEASREICPPISSPSSIGGQQTATVTDNTDVKCEDIFQMDTGSVVSGPTLAELNSNLNSESLMEDIGSIVTSQSLRQNIGNKSVSSSISSALQTPVPTASSNVWATYLAADKGTNIKMEPVSNRLADNLSKWKALTQTVVSADQLISQTSYRPGMYNPTTATVSKVPQTSVKSSPALHKLLQQNVNKPASTVSSQQEHAQSMTGRSSPGKRKSPPVTGPFNSHVVDQKWEEIKQFLNDDPKETVSPPQPKIKRESRTSVSSTVGSITSVEDDDDDADSDIDSDIDGHHWMSDSEMEDEESRDGWKGGQAKDSKTKKERQYFWQYNIQSKGPKGTRVNFGMDTSDPHVLHDFEDPVFDPHTCTIVGMGTAIRHGGKARKGDGNDVSPNPKKLCQIGQQLKRLNKQINSFAPLNELPVSSRNKSKKEKNKLASRACRLKKKAQHEANKLKLYGLELEHKQLMKVLQRIKEELKIQVNKGCDAEDRINLSKLLEDLIKENLSDMVAGNAADYVNKITKRVDEGDPTGGLDQT